MLEDCSYLCYEQSGQVDLCHHLTPTVTLLLGISVMVTHLQTHRQTHIRHNWRHILPSSPWEYQSQVQFQEPCSPNTTSPDEVPCNKDNVTLLSAVLVTGGHEVIVITCHT